MDKIFYDLIVTDALERNDGNHLKTLSTILSRLVIQPSILIPMSFLKAKKSWKAVEYTSRKRRKMT